MPSNPPWNAPGLSDAERVVLQAAMTGSVAGPNDATIPFEDRVLWLDADFLRRLLREQEPGWTLHERGVRLRHLRIVGFLDLSGCDLRHPLRFEDCLIEGIGLADATLATLTFVGGTVNRIEGDRASAAALFLRGVTVRQGVRFLGARIAGDIDCEGAILSAQQPGAPMGSSNLERRDVALGLDGAAIGGAFFLRAARLNGTVMGSGLSVGKVLDARGLQIQNGGVELHTAMLGSDVDFGGAALMGSPATDGLVLTQANIAGTLRLTERFQTDRRVILHDARIVGNLSLRGARFLGAIPFAITAQRLHVEGTFDLDSTTCFGADDARIADAGEHTPTSRLAPRRRRGKPLLVRASGSAFDLTGASVGSLSDQWADWPRPNRVLGFRYKEIAGATSSRADWWQRWLMLQGDEDLRRFAADQPNAGASGFKPQPWDQAILALRGAGYLRDAEDLAIAKERAAHAHDRTPGHPFHVLWGWCAGYGYRPLRLLWALVLIYPLSVWIYSAAADAGAMAPTKEGLVASAEYQRCHPEHGGNWTRCALAPAYPDFNAWAYGLQMLLPAIELRQSKDWAPVPWRRPVTAVPASKAASGAASAVAVEAPEPLPPTSDWGTRALWCSWFEAAAGLAAPVLVGLALTGLIRRKSKD